MTYQQDDADKWPSFSDELTRKGMTVLDKWMKRVDAGTAKARDLFIVADVLWEAMSGLAHEAELRILEEVLREIRAEAEKKRKAAQ